MTETSGPPRAGTIADLRNRQQEQIEQAMARWEQEQIEQATSFGQRYGNALLDGLRSTTNVFLDERNQTAQQIRGDAETIRAHSQQMTAAAKTAARMWWLPTLAICALMIGGSLTFAWLKTTAALQTPAPTATTTIKGQTYEVLTGPNWITCPYDGRQRPCRPVKG